MVWLQTHLEQYAGRYFAASSTATAALIIYKKWGLAAAICFTVTTVSGVYFLQNRMSKVSPLSKWASLVISFVTIFSPTAGIVLGLLAPNLCWAGSDRQTQVQEMGEKLEKHVVAQEIVWKSFDERLKKVMKECGVTEEQAQQVMEKFNDLLKRQEESVESLEKIFPQVQQNTKNLEATVSEMQSNNRKIAALVNARVKEKKEGT